MNTVGKAMPRVDGPLKTTGVADYASDRHLLGMLYAVPVGATIARGTLTKLDVGAAEKTPGVRKVYHRGNLPPVYRVVGSQTSESRPPFEDDVISYYDQYVALVVADTFEQAMAGASTVRATYREEKPNVAVGMEVETGVSTQHERGNAQQACDAASIKVDAVYTTPPETHCAIELHASVAVPLGDVVELYDTSQAIIVHRNSLAQHIGVGQDKVRVITKYLGSGFGGKLWPWPLNPLAAAVARDMNRPIKLVLNRDQSFGTAGHRCRTQQRVRLSASPDGKLTSIGHDYVNATSMLDDRRENCGETTPYLYSCPNVRVTRGLARRNIGTPAAMRGPGAVPGLFATETAMDEMARALRMDPVEFRQRNEPEKDESNGRPWSSRHLMECYEVGKKVFGWDRYTSEVGTMREGELTLGWGVACAGWMAGGLPTEATVDLRNDGTARVACGTQDIGTGTYTMVAQFAAERLGLDTGRIEPVLGHSDLPPGPTSGGSLATGSLVPAILLAADAAIRSIVQMATSPKGPFAGRRAEDLAYTEGKVHLKDEPAAQGVPFGEVLKRVNVRSASGRGRSQGPADAQRVSMHCYGVHFTEVTWDPGIARLRVPRIVTVIDAGRIVNPTTAANQIAGAAIMGIGMGLLEETVYDERSGAPVNRNLADYVVAVNADAPRVDVHFLDHPDTAVNEYGVRGLGEIGLAGVAAALGNAVFHATGKRVRELPITIDKLL